MSHKMNNVTSIINISYDLEKIEDIKINVKLKGFVIHYNSNNYLITLHRYYPIKKINIEEVMFIDNLNYFENENIIQSSWNELLIIKNMDGLECNKIKHIKASLPNLNQELYCEDKKLMVTDYCYNNINHLPLYPRVLYIKVTMIDTCNVGSPVFQKDGKLIGIISDTYCGNTYIIPSYYILKTLQKECNKKIYTINNNNITKIDKYNVTSKGVYHQIMAIKMPLDVYLTLEGDKNKILFLNKNEENRYIEMDNLVISNERNLLKEKNNYILNACLLIILRVINNRIMDEIINFIRLNLEKNIVLNVIKNDILDEIKNISLSESEENKIIKTITVNDINYNLTFVAN